MIGRGPSTPSAMEAQPRNQGGHPSGYLRSGHRPGSQAYAFSAASDWCT
jgi:hypothetical protein